MNTHNLTRSQPGLPALLVASSWRKGKKGKGEERKKSGKVLAEKCINHIEWQKNEKEETLTFPKNLLYQEIKTNIIERDA